MLGKLLKYELKASARTLLPLYAGTLLIALVCGISMAVQTSNMNKFRQSMADGVAVSVCFLPGAQGRGQDQEQAEAQRRQHFQAVFFTVHSLAASLPENRFPTGSISP